MPSQYISSRTTQGVGPIQGMAHIQGTNHTQDMGPIPDMGLIQGRVLAMCLKPFLPHSR